MQYPYRHSYPAKIVTGILQSLLSLACLFSASLLYASDNAVTVIKLELGGFHFIPQEIQISENQPAILRLVNTDSVTPHNFTMKTSSDSPAIDVDVLGGESVDVQLPPLPSGHYTFYCGNKLLFMKSHREKGMEGSLIVNPK